MGGHLARLHDVIKHTHVARLIHMPTLLLLLLIICSSMAATPEGLPPEHYIVSDWLDRRLDLAARGVSCKSVLGGGGWQPRLASGALTGEVEDGTPTLDSDDDSSLTSYEPAYACLSMRPPATGAASLDRNKSGRGASGSAFDELSDPDFTSRRRGEAMGSLVRSIETALGEQDASGRCLRQLSRGANELQGCTGTALELVTLYRVLLPHRAGRLVWHLPSQDQVPDRVSIDFEGRQSLTSRAVAAAFAEALISQRWDKAVMVIPIPVSPFWLPRASITLHYKGPIDLATLPDGAEVWPASPGAAAIDRTRWMRALSGQPDQVEDIYVRLPPVELRPGSKLQLPSNGVIEVIE